MIGLQMWGVKALLEKDLPGGLAMLRQMGFEAFEPLYSMRWDSPADFQNRIDAVRRVGFAVPSVYLTECADEDLGQRLLQAGRDTGVSLFVVSNCIRSEADGRRWGRILNEACRVLAPYGIRLAYHNHEMEMQEVAPGKNILDCILEEAPDLLVEYDIGWAAFRQDEVALAHRYAQRIVVLHCKDFYPGAEEHDMFAIPKALYAPVGMGRVRHKQVLQMRGGFPQFGGAVLIDQDETEGSMVQACRIGYEYLKEVLL